MGTNERCVVVCSLWRTIAIGQWDENQLCVVSFAANNIVHWCYLMKGNLFIWIFSILFDCSDDASPATFVLSFQILFLIKARVYRHSCSKRVESFPACFVFFLFTDHFRLSRLSTALDFVFLLWIVPWDPLSCSPTISIFSVSVWSGITLCLCLRMIFRRRVMIMLSLPDHWHNSLSLLFFSPSSSSPNDNERKNKKKKKMYEPSSEGRALAYVYCSIAIEKSFDSGWALTMCCFHVYFSLQSRESGAHWASDQPRKQKDRREKFHWRDQTRFLPSLSVFLYNHVEQSSTVALSRNNMTLFSPQRRRCRWRRRRRERRYFMIRTFA